MEKTFHMLLYRAFHAQRNYLRPFLSEIGLGSGQPKLLSYLSRKTECCQRELADYFEIDPAAVSRMLDTLEKGGFIARKTDSSNRRADSITLTQKGVRAHNVWQKHCEEMEDIMLRGFSDAERTQFADFLSRAHQNFHETWTKEGDVSCGN